MSRRQQETKVHLSTQSCNNLFYWTSQVQWWLWEQEQANTITMQKENWRKHPWAAWLQIDDTTTRMTNILLPNSQAMNYSTKHQDKTSKSRQTVRTYWTVAEQSKQTTMTIWIIVVHQKTVATIQLAVNKTQVVVWSAQQRNKSRRMIGATIKQKSSYERRNKSKRCHMSGVIINSRRMGDAMTQ